MSEVRPIPVDRSLPRRPASWLALLLVLPLHVATAAEAPPKEAPAKFGGEERVTAIDVVFAASNRSGAVPADLQAEDFEVKEDGETRPVVGLSRLGTGPGAEPWRIVVYFDRSLASPGAVQAAALNLAERTSQLIALGTVEIWIADPAPEILLNPTRDREQVENAFSRVLVDYPGEEQISALRRDVVGPLAASGAPPSPAGSAAETVAAAVERELAIVQGSQDALLSWMAGEPGSGPRALLWVGSGYDLDPVRFYRQALPKVAAPAANPRQLSDATDVFARTLAAYGWVVFPLSFTDLGSGSDQASQQFEQYRRQQIDGINGDSAMLFTGKVQLGGKGKASAEAAPTGAQLLAGTAPLATVAEAAGGTLLDKAAGIDPMLDSLGRRFRLTFQVERALDGRLRPLVLTAKKGGLTVTAPRWVRSATPEGVTEARVRRILTGELEVGDLALAARFRAEESAAAGSASDGLRAGSLQLKLDLAAKGSRPPEPENATLRLTVAYGAEDAPPTFSHEILAKQDLTGTSWSYEKALSLPENAAWLVVIVEDLASGTWGARDVEP